jgi:hypothetical protein
MNLLPKEFVPLMLLQQAVSVFAPSGVLVMRIDDPTLAAT